MKKRKETSFIQAAVPPHRGAARHVERYDDEAKVVFDNMGHVAEIHTTQDPFRRLHEVLHARHTNHRAYKGRRFEVRNLIEDCRLHMKHWPWPAGETPEIFADDVDAMFAAERKRREKVLKETGAVDPFGDFAQQLRQNATYTGMGRTRKVKSFVSSEERRKGRGRMRSESYQMMADNIMYLIRQGRHEQAAAMLEEAFFYSDEDKPKPERGDGKPDKRHPGEDGEESDEMGESMRGDGEGDETEDDEGRWGIHQIPDMETIELPFVEPTDHAETGFRLTTSGSRIYRPALRRPVLPHRLFLKRAPVAPGGSIIFDASGSMGVEQPVLLDCCLRAPAATIAFYSGDDCPTGEGKLYVYAKNGMRASGIDECEMYGGNGVDGQALDWLMAQESPRIFVTDRGFCGSGDSVIQLTRLATLEDLGEVQVYESYSLFQAEFPPIAKAA